MVVNYKNVEGIIEEAEKSNDIEYSLNLLYKALRVTSRHDNEYEYILNMLGIKIAIPCTVKNFEKLNGIKKLTNDMILEYFNKIYDYIYLAPYGIKVNNEISKLNDISPLRNVILFNMDYIISRIIEAQKDYLRVLYENIGIYDLSKLVNILYDIFLVDTEAELVEELNYILPKYDIDKISSLEDLKSIKEFKDILKSYFKLDDLLFYGKKEV